MLKLKNNYYLLRHGQTNYQLKRPNFIYPRPDTPKVRLTKTGQAQIKAAARKLKNVGIDLIYASDFYRTKQTAKIVAKAVGAKLFFDKRLRDLNIGIYHGRKKEEFHRNFPRDAKMRFFKKPPEGESWFDCKKRMLSLLKKVDKKHKGKTILIISHGDPLWLLEGGVKGFSKKEMLKYKTVGYMDFGEVKKLYGA